ncbi:hypothetical protein JIG36_32920 [Actinoplanes sp. LDG1-06]|uniref:Uncharacterized protein n=1 Tax=Paractinoplanes ovalisporus TaxID=2810368 RepID=A0ABS2AKF8_9ACTN|nr:hypothetical protein [Actinoplanes ovalisporus]MBM2620327.1 hypothetical protein [Actinoplanes ovalisporus]
MATFYQEGQNVHGNQVNADSVDLRGADLGVASGPGNREESARDIEAVLAVLRRAAENGLVGRADADRAAGELGAAANEARSGNTGGAATRVERAVRILQAAAPMAAIAGTLTSVWGNLAGSA